VTSYELAHPNLHGQRACHPLPVHAQV
jgi:hypothetical protein